MIRVGNDYYIATSTFEWFPGVQIYHSRDPSPCADKDIIAAAKDLLSQVRFRLVEMKEVSGTISGAIEITFVESHL